MSSLINSSFSTQQSAFNSAQQLQQSYKNLFTGLSTGNLKLAQTSFNNLKLSASSVQSNPMLAQISAALNNNDIASARNVVFKNSTSGGLLNAIVAEDTSQTSSTTTPLVSASTLAAVAASNASPANKAAVAATANPLSNSSPIDLLA